MEADDESREARAAKARRRAMEFLALRESFGDAEAAESKAWPGLDAAEAESVMAAVRAAGTPLQNAPRIVPVGAAGRRWRVAALSAAAALITACSSALTFWLIRASGTVDVRFVLAAPEAASVMLAADFNHWSPDGYELQKAGDGTWSIVVPLRKGRTYAYNFIIDGERWVADPSAAMLLDDGFGGASSSLSL